MESNKKSDETTDNKNVDAKDEEPKNVAKLIKFSSLWTLIFGAAIAFALGWKSQDYALIFLPTAEPLVLWIITGAVFTLAFFLAIQKTKFKHMTIIAFLGKREFFGHVIVLTEGYGWLPILFSETDISGVEKPLNIDDIQDVFARNSKEDGDTEEDKDVNKDDGTVAKPNESATVPIKKTKMAVQHRVLDPSKYINVSDPEKSLTEFAARALRFIVSQYVAVELASVNDELGERIKTELKKDADRWGIEIITVRVTELALPKSITDASATIEEELLQRKSEMLETETVILIARKYMELEGLTAQEALRIAQAERGKAVQINIGGSGTPIENAAAILSQGGNKPSGSEALVATGDGG